MKKESLLYFDQHYNQFLQELIQFLAIPSISTDPAHQQDVQSAAVHIADKLSAIGVENVRIFPTRRHPIVYGEYLKAGPSQPTLLIYGHYDVQPDDPIDLWSTPPFTPTIRDEILYARGASDMKGQIYACVAAIESIIKTDHLPVNVKFIFEGEEEIGSPNLNQFLIEYADLLKSDCALNTDAGMVNKDTPAISYGLRGLAYFEVRVFGPDRDLHSGSYGGIVHNPAQVLSELISQLHDQDGRVTLDGFYDDVLPLTAEERENMSLYGLSEDEYCSQVGVPALWGEKEYSPIERLGARPTLEVNGFLSGFTGQGSKTIIPSKAMAKISTRLVPNQDPLLIYGKLVDFMKKNAPKTVRWEVEQLSTGAPSISDTNLPETRALMKAYEEVWGVKPALKREGGSVPVVADMQKHLGIDSVLTGFGLPDDRIHSPNEKLDLPTWRKGIQALIHFFYNAKRE
ncbi:MAG TPA: dipeptidase [Anaerolineaceae bacterium]|nr:dipeptidase [Anaerolineaceae bacterium]